MAALVVSISVGLGLAVGVVGQAPTAADGPTSSVDDPGGGDGSIGAELGRDTSRATGVEKREATRAEAGGGPSPPQQHEAPSSPSLITRGISVQVLNGTLAPRADERMVSRLRRLHFAVLAVNRSARIYDVTTVFWSRPSYRAAAEALARRFGWRANYRPRNLSRSVAIHVVVGRDEN